MTVQDIPMTLGASATATVRVFDEVDHHVLRRRPRSGWLAQLRHVVALPSGIPPGRARPEPDGHSTF